MEKLTPADLNQTSRMSAMIHAQNYDYDTFAKETDQIGKHLAKTLKK